MSFISAEDVRRIEQAMRDAKTAIEDLKQQNEVLVKMVILEKQAHEKLKEWIRGFQS